MNVSFLRNRSAIALAALAVCACDHDGPPNTQPGANAGADQAVTEGTVVRLAGAGSDAEGAVTYSWSQLSGPAVALSSTSVASPSFVAPVAPIGTTAVVELRLSVTDAGGRIASDDVRITARSNDYLVYYAIDGRTQTQEIRAYDAETGTRSTLAEPGPIPRPTQAFGIAPDRSRVAYLADALYSVLPNGTGRVRLADLPYAWSWSPDSSRIAFSVFNQTGVLDLYTVPAAGGTPVLIDDTVMSFGGGLLAWQWAPNGSTITFLTRDVAAGVTELHAAAPDGTAHVALSNAQPGEDVFSWRWSPDGTWLAYTDNVRIFAVRPDGTQRRAVMGPRSSGVPHVWSWSPTGTHLGALFYDTNDGEVVVVRPDGSALTSIALESPVGGDLQWLPDGSRVLYFTRETGVYELLSARLDGSGRARLGPAAPINTLAAIPAPDSSRVVLFTAESLTTPPTDLFTSRPDGTGLARLTEPGPPGGSEPNFIGWSPDATRLLFAAETVTAGVKDLYSIRPDGTERVRLNAPFTGSGRTVVPFASGWAPDGSRITFVQRDPTFLLEAFSVFPDGTGRAPLTPGPTLVRQVGSSPDSSRIAYVDSNLAGTSFELVVMRPDGTDRVSLQSTPFITSYAWAP